jgi:PBSX family phage terminase large subunit
MQYICYFIIKNFILKGMDLPLSPKQIEFIVNSNAKWNIAHGSVRSGKTIGATFRFLQEADASPDSKLFITGHTFDTAYRNVIRPIMESKELSIFRPFCTWSGKKLHFRDKTITVLGAKDEGAIGNFQGVTMSKVLCDEITLYPPSIIDMIDSRLSLPHSRGIATCNPSYPSHPIKKWIDKAQEGNPQYYALHWTLEDNPYVDEEYKSRLKESTTGLFYKRNYLGLWCMAEGAVFDFFDKKIHVVKRPPRSAEYWIAGVDYGTINSFSCTLIGISTGRYDQSGISRWAEKEFVWDSSKQHRQKTNSEYADDVLSFLEPYSIHGIYIDPSAASFKLELRKRGLKVIDADNDVQNGIEFVTSEMKKGNLLICDSCPNLIREVESYVWDSRAAEKGEDAPLKKDDHSIDSLRYAVYTHKIAVYDYEGHNRRQQEHWKNRFGYRGI